MLSKTERQFAVIYGIIVLFEIISGSIASLQNLHYIAKPAILISLIFFFYKAGKDLSQPLKNLMFSALICSLLGDILLMFVGESAHFFTLGLVAFLIAHVMYILLFLKHRNKTRSPLKFGIVLIIYALSLFYLLKDSLGDMLIPVAIYMIVILSMATTAYLRKDSVNILSYGLVFIGALCFMISDSILALNKFYQPIPFSNISIMLTYALAQLLIVLGILKLKN
ncbi:lysoplasmalogenase [Winogradskyella sp. SYSU M77433]|uniref:lysoplasmalogenase n=1 Tax=Winogradskyella sp. SYSU M77433 TaxID=3042722 RepID=UPI00248012D4|nr:lysoplasmalogenase [Winogradskyella sp. SYSU M77433]MDH7914085.1 lysoplasmalogenase [Winogradskyella sp. SYSU M77433]